MTTASIIALIGTMLVLAAIPSLSVLTVTTRTASLGLSHGLATSAGIVAGDLVYILIALLGLATMASSYSYIMEWLRYVGALYLVFLAWEMFTTNRHSSLTNVTPASNLVSSFTAGLVLTLADYKALLFYMVFFPAFVDIARLSLADILLLCSITIIAVGGIKAAYALLTARSVSLLSAKHQQSLSKLAAALLFVVAIALVLPDDIMSL